MRVADVVAATSLRCSRIQVRQMTSPELGIGCATIFRVTHIDNVRWILDHGLHCRNSPEQDPNFVRIGSEGLITRRPLRAVPIPPGGTLSDYVPFYFTPHSMMMYNIRTGYDSVPHVPNCQLVILFTSLRRLLMAGRRAVFTDRHAFLRTAEFFSSPADFDKIDWDLLRRRDFRRDYDDPEKTDRYQAEALVHRFLPVENIDGIVCYSKNIRRTLLGLQREAEVPIEVLSEPGWYFR